MVACDSTAQAVREGSSPLIKCWIGSFFIEATRLIDY